MINVDEILAAHEPASWAEMLALVNARAQVRAGADPLDVLQELERSRDAIDDLAALEHENGMAAVFGRVWGHDDTTKETD
jgi:hypothetical protein